MGKRVIVLGAIAILLIVLFALLPVTGGRAFAKTTLQPGNKNALMLEPMSVEANQTFEPVKEALRNAGYFVTTVLGDDVRPESYKDLNKYGVVFIFAHGACWQDSEGNHAALQTRLKDSLTLKGGLTTGLRYWSDFTSGRLVKYGDYIYVTDRYLSYYNKGFPASLVYMYSCHIMENDSMWNVVRDKGSMAICGFAREVWTEEKPSKPRSKDDNAAIDFFGEATKQNIDIETAYAKASQASSADPGWKLVTEYDAATNAFYLNWKEREQVRSSPAKLLASGTWNSDDPNHPWIFRGGNMYYGSIPDNGNAISPETHESGPGVYEIVDGTHIRYATFQDVMSNGYVPGDRSTYPWNVTEVIYIDGNHVRLPDASTLGGSLTLSRLP
jgi:hypothetical protein